MSYGIYTGIISRTTDTGDADRYLTILSTELGKLECYAKGIRKQKSKLASQAGLLSYGEFHMHENGERRILTSAKAVESFYAIREDVVKCAFATHFLEIAQDVIVDSQPFPEALRTLLNALYALCYRDDLTPEFISRVYEIRILSLAGFLPLLDNCSICGAGIGAGASFAIFGDGVVCAAPACKHASGHIVPISGGALSAIRFVAGCGAGDIFSFEISAAVATELGAAIPPYLRNQFGKEYDKPDEAERYRAFEREIMKMNKGIKWTSKQ